MNEEKANLGEELYSLLAELLNRRMNRAVQDSIRGEYGTLHYLTYVQNGVSAGILTNQLHVVPGRMTDILSSLERKGLVVRKKSEEDKRRVLVYVTAKGRRAAKQKREAIKQEYAGLLKQLGTEDTEELIRLLKIVLAYET
ncbi:MAG: MarR family transcriptional regulator [Clostridium sp.]|nr:MarR family transcriptional regulator [Clostridium sp.]